jgi:Tail-tube assembly protein
MVKLDKVIVLPMPNDYVVKTRVEYRETPMTELTKVGDYLNNAAGGVISDLISLGKNRAISKLVNTAKEGATNEKALLAEDNLAENPKKEMMFDSFDRRTFQFNYTFAPKSKLESNIVSEIIETLRYYSLPELKSGKMFYIFPAQFEISMMLGQLDNPNIPRIGTCVLSDISVNYSPMGTWAILPNGAPLAITMSLNFVEMEMIDRKRIFNKESAITSGF